MANMRYLREAPSQQWQAGFRVATLTLMLGAGCSLLPLVGTGDGESTSSTAAASPAARPIAPPRPDLFAPKPPPAGFDPEHAHLKLEEIPEDPPAPASAQADPDPELPRQALRNMEEARRLFAQQRYSETIVEAGKALRYHSNILEAHRLSALSSFFIGKNAEAGQFADSAIALRPDDLTCRYLRGRLAEKADQPDAAFMEYRIALKCPAPDDDPYRALTHHYLGMLLYESGFYQAAVDQLKAFEEAALWTGPSPENPELATIVKSRRTAPLLALADSHEALGQYGPAADVLALVLEHSPESVHVRVRYIKNLVRARRFDAAQAEAVRHAGKARDLESVELLLAVYRASDRTKQGLAAVGKLAEENPDQSDLALFYADALIAARSFDEAVIVLNDLAARDADTAAAARWKLVSIHRAQGSHREWLQAIGAQLATDPVDFERGLDELSQIPRDEAARLIDEALGEGKASSPTSRPSEDVNTRADSFFCLGWLADRLNRPEDAEALYAKALEIKPDFMLAVVGTAELWVDRCQWDKALKALADARTDNAMLQAKIERLQARCYDGLDQLTDAVRYYQASLEKDPDPDTLLRLGLMLERFGQHAEAALAFEEIIRRNPDRVEARERLVMNLLNRWSEGESLKMLLAQLKEMQDNTPEHPATVRSTALVRLLLRQPPDLDGYIETLTGLVEAKPDDHLSRRALVVGLIRKGDYDTAVREVNIVLKDRPFDAEAHELLALALMRNLNVDEAARQLGRSLQWYPNREVLLRNLAETRLVQQDYPAAISLWQKLLSLEVTADRHPGYRSRLISTCLQAEDYDQVRELAEQWLEDADEDELAAIRSYVLAADASQEQHDAYLERCRAWLAENDEDGLARQWLLGIGELPGQAGGGLIAAGREEEAVVMATVWAAQSPDDLLMRYTLLQTLQAAHRFEDLLEIARSDLALAARPEQRLEALRLVADASRRAQRHDEAVEALKEMAALAAQLNEVELSFRLDDLLIGFLAQARQYDEAITQANRVLAALDERDARLQQLARDDVQDVSLRVQIIKAQEQIRQQRAHLLRSLSFIYTRQELRDQAIEHLKEALRLAPNDAGINNDLGYTLADAGMELDEAERMLRAAVSEVLWNGVSEDDRQAAFLDSLGWLYYKRSQFEPARRWLALAAKMEDGQDPVIHDHLGDVQWRLGRAEAAVAAWKRALELHDKRVREEHADPDEKLVESVKSKLQEAQGAGKPAVATTTAD